jgi:hypothetical protein
MLAAGMGKGRKRSEAKGKPDVLWMLPKLQSERAMMIVSCQYFPMKVAAELLAQAVVTPATPARLPAV